MYENNDKMNARWKYYAAYGSNINLQQMAQRCPNAIIAGKGVLKNYRLRFRRGGFANVEPLEGGQVPVLVWQTTDTDERSLDYYEGYPKFYKKGLVNIDMGLKIVKAYIYVMTNEERGECRPPSPQYLKSIKRGYIENGIDTTPLETARISAWVESQKRKRCI